MNNKNAGPGKDCLLGTQQAADILGIPAQTLVNWRCTGRYSLPFIRVGRLIRYRLSDIETWIDSRRVANENTEDGAG